MKYRLSVIIPVLNEACIINRTLLHLQNARRGLAVEVIVVDGDPAGGTQQLFQATSGEWAWQQELSLAS